MACACSCCCGACCNGTTCTQTHASDCTGQWKGQGTTCSPNVCELGACCINGNCSQLTSAQCAAQGGVFIGLGVNCTSSTCHGRCCYTAYGTVRDCMVTDRNQCTGLGGDYYGDGTNCINFECSRGACCNGGTCTSVFAPQCTGTFRGIGSICHPDTCQATGACNTTSQSGGAGVTVNYFAMPVAEGSVPFSYDAFSVPDAFKVEGGGQVLLDIPSTSGSGSRTFQKPTGVTVVKVTVTGSSSGTAWTYTIGCPNPLP